MKAFSALIILISSLSMAPAHAGFVVGNGGDAIVCKKAPDNSLNGTYALDYVITLTDKLGTEGLSPVSSWKDSSERLLRVLTEKVPTLVPYFKEFTETVFNRDYSKTKVWEPSPFGLRDLDDESITSLIPQNCKTESKTQLIQAVIREFQNYSGTQRGHIVYKYDPEVVQSLDQKSPLQLSFLMVHEWLWDLSQNVNRNRRINRFLHSQEIETMSSEDVIKSLQGMGLAIPGVQSDLFAEDSCQGTRLTMKDLTDYYPQYAMLANWGQIRIERRERQLDCPEANCVGQWRKPSISSPILEDFPLFLSPSWDYGPGEFPLKIVSPSYMTSTGRSVRHGSGQIACRFIQDPEQNIECKIIEPDFAYPLLNISGFEGPLEKLPLLKGVLTTECFRLKATSNYNIDYLDFYGGHRGAITVEQETVLYLRAKDGMFMKPR